MITTPLLPLFVAVNFTLHPTVLDCRLAPSAIAELAEGAQVVVDVDQLVHGAKIEAVGAVGPNVPEGAKVALRGRA